LKGRGAHVRTLLGTLFGVGRLPRAPGSAASAAAFLATLALPASAYAAAAASIAVASSVATLALGRFAEADYGRPDPPAFVLDEVAGYGIAVLRFEKPGIVELLAALFLFRLFDGWKPFPLKRAERLPGGIGILLDDLLAAGYTAALLAALRTVVPTSVWI
jgi:phosphatidylglycerophosphatase A